MKKIAIIALVLVVALGMCACRMGSDNESTPSTNTTTAPQTTAPQTTAPQTEPNTTNPTEPSIAPNVPDPSVDDGHLVEPSDGEGAAPKIRGRFNEIR